MSNPYVAEIRIFPFNFPPKGWAFCDGQLLAISQNTALFSLLGTTYGGDGKSTFGLPNLQGCAALHPGQGPGLSLYDLGQTGGQSVVTLLTTEIPAHAHNFQVTPSSRLGGGSNSPSSNYLSGGAAADKIYAASGSNVLMNQVAISVTGSDQPHNNMPPYLTLNFCIAMQGVFPPR